MKKYLTPEVIAALNSLPTSDAPVQAPALVTAPDLLLQRAQVLDPEMITLSLDEVEAQLQKTFDDDPWTLRMLSQVPAAVLHRYTYVYVNQGLLTA
ncbi:hypothetical protein [Hymenobacter sp. BT491]|uniref:hypothetical protein n=1 Tax=Hymenobacter sp. BT491 TaxID=2766779 RepID=UPI001653C1C1|nr:hypothetical protein [Hymenobacter sp. BT491]MBC6989745.1 hypothetical protein [Hymenobacter sp. BT491]